MTTTTTNIEIRRQLGFWDMVTLRMALSDRLTKVREVYGAGSSMECDVRDLTASLGLDFDEDVESLNTVVQAAAQGVAA